MASATVFAATCHLVIISTRVRQLCLPRCLQYLFTAFIHTCMLIWILAARIQNRCWHHIWNALRTLKTPEPHLSYILNSVGQVTWKIHSMTHHTFIKTLFTLPIYSWRKVICSTAELLGAFKAWTPRLHFRMYKKKILKRKLDKMV